MESKRRLATFLIAASSFAWLAANAQAVEYHIIKTIPVPGLHTVDFSTIDQQTGIMFVSDRSNRSIDVVDTNSDKLLRQYGGFKGVFTQLETSGPNIAYQDGHTIWATDAPSQVRAVDERSGKITDTVDCGGGIWRVDGAAMDYKDHIFMGESADTPVPYLCWIDTKTGKLIEKQKLMHEATAGLEGSVWDPATDMIYLALPEVHHGPGAVYVIDPHTRKVVKEYPQPAGDECEAGGISLNLEQQEILIGCDHKPQTDILDLKTGKVTMLPILGGTDQTAFDPGMHMYFVASRRGSMGPVLGVIDSRTHQLVSHPKTAKLTHAVAVNHSNHKVYLPMIGNDEAFDNDPAKGLSCLHGCIGVYAPE